MPLETCSIEIGVAEAHASNPIQSSKRVCCSSFAFSRLALARRIDKGVGVVGVPGAKLISEVHFVNDKTGNVDA